MKEDLIKVSIIVPAYNVENYIEKCLDSLINQTLQEIEIIVVDDGSKDNTKNIIRNFCSKDKRIKFIEQENKKQGAARNNGIKHSCGEYIGFIDSDDWVDLNYFEKLYNTAKKYDSDIALADYVRTGNGRTKKRLNIKKELLATDLDSKFEICKQAKHPCPTNKIYRKSLLEKNNLVFPEGSFCEDKIFTCKAVYYANSVVSVPNTFYYYFRRPHSTVLTKGVGQDKNNAQQEVLKFLREKNVELKSSCFWAVKKNYKKFGILWYQIKEGIKTEKHLLFGGIKIKEKSLEKIRARAERKRLLKEFKEKSGKKINISDFFSTDYDEPTNIDLITIAFNNPKIIDYQIKLYRKFLLGSFRHIICDNSNQEESALKIREICEANNITYRRVTIDCPSGYSDSHGRALNWTYNNVIKHRQNDFGFVDHDFFPVKQFNIEEYLKENNLYGFIRKTKKIWFLWPAFSFFKYDYVKNLKLNFRKHRDFGFLHHAGADSGSGNWGPLYSKYDISKIPHVSCEYFDVINNKKPNKDDYKTGYEPYIQENLSQFIDDSKWFHSLCGAEWRSNVRKKNEIIYEMLEKYLNS